MIFPTIEDYVGHTPLVRLERLPGDSLYGKGRRR